MLKSDTTKLRVKENWVLGKRACELFRFIEMWWLPNLAHAFQIVIEQLFGFDSVICTMYSCW